MRWLVKGGEMGTVLTTRWREWGGGMGPASPRWLGLGGGTGPAFKT